MKDCRTGPWGEEKAARFLRLRGWHIEERNFSCRYGEIDLIARRGDVLAFVEVKTRKNDAHGEAREFVTAAKQQRILSAASLYLSEKDSGLQPRFDVIEIYAPEGADTRFPKIVHIPDAFQ